MIVTKVIFIILIVIFAFITLGVFGGATSGATAEPLVGVAICLLGLVAINIYNKSGK